MCIFTFTFDVLLASGLLQLCSDNFQEAYEHFKKIIEVEPTNVVVSVIDSLSVENLNLINLDSSVDTLRSIWV